MNDIHNFFRMLNSMVGGRHQLRHRQLITEGTSHDAKP